MVVDQERTDQFLAMLARYVRILRQLADIPLEDYRADPRNFGSAERFLQLAIETTLSIGHHIGDFDRFARAVAEHLAEPDGER